MAISNRDASGPISRREVFKTHNGTLSASDLIGQYIVYSYAEPIAFFDTATSTWYATERHFSPTTGRHQGIINYGMSKSGHEVKWTQMRLTEKGWL